MAVEEGKQVSFAETMKGFFEPLTKYIPDNIKEFAGSLKQGLSPYFSNTFSFVKDAFSGIKNKATEVASYITAKKSNEGKDVVNVSDTVSYSPNEFTNGQIDDLQKLDKIEVFMRSYANERDDYNERLSSLTSAQEKGHDVLNEIAELRRDYLMKTDGTFYKSIEDKYGLTNDFDVNTISTMDKESLLQAVVYDERNSVLNGKSLSDFNGSLYSRSIEELDPVNAAHDIANVDGLARYSRDASLETIGHSDAAMLVTSSLSSDLVRGGEDADKVVLDLELCEYSFYRYNKDAQDYAKAMENASHVLDSEGRSYMERLAQDKYLKKDDGTYYDTLEDKYGLDPLPDDVKSTENAERLLNDACHLNDGFSFGKISANDRAIASARSYVDRMEPDIRKWLETDGEFDAIKAMDTMRQPGSNNDISLDSLSDDSVRGFKVDMPESLSRDDYNDLFSNYSDYMQLYIDQKKAYEMDEQTLLSNGVTDGQAVLTESYLLKSDGTYYSSLEDKFGFDASFGNGSIDDLQGKVNIINERLSQIKNSSTFDPNSESNRYTYESLTKQMFSRAADISLDPSMESKISSIEDSMKHMVAVVTKEPDLPAEPAPVKSDPIKPNEYKFDDYDFDEEIQPEDERSL